MSNEIIFKIHQAPYSVDPLEFDYAIHHRAFKSVLGTLVSQTSLSGDTPYLAETWETNTEKTVWTYKLREGLTFQDGSTLDAASVKLSIFRLGLRLAKKNSNHEFFDNLIGFKNLSRLDQDIEGVTASGNKITFHFKKSMPRINHFLSFGVFAITSPSDFDTSGNWKNPKKINSSGAYIISEWKEESLRLELRNSLSQIGHPNKFASTTISWAKDAQKPNIISGTSLDIPYEGFKFRGDVYSGIAYVHCYSWKNSKSPMSIKSNREIARSTFYQYLKQNSITPSKSFFPNSGFIQKETVLKSNDFKYTLMNFSMPNTLITKAVSKISELYPNIELKELPFEETVKYLDPNYSPIKLDCRISRTSILLESPKEDLIFMFRSKEGISLPDPTKKINKMLNADQISLNEIEKQLNEDAIIWPIAHFANGLWAEKTIDLSQLNTAHPPADFSWIGRRD